MKFRDITQNSGDLVSLGKDKFFNMVDPFSNKLQHRKGIEVRINLKFPKDMGFFICGTTVYELYTGRYILTNFDIKNIKKLIDREKITPNYENEYKIWFDEQKEKNRREFGIKGSIQDEKIVNEIDPTKQRSIDFKKKINDELKLKLKAENIEMIDKEQKFNIKINNSVKRVTGFLLKTKRFKYEYFVNLEYNQFRNYEVIINLNEKTTGLNAGEYYGIDAFINRIPEIINLEKQLNMDKFKNEKGYPLN